MEARKVRCREIAEADIEAVSELLTRGFVGRSRDYWLRGLHRQSEREIPPGCPRYGYLLENGGRPVGVLLLLYTQRIEAGEPNIRCNVSSWYVEPEFRNYATLLTSMAQKNKQVTYVNISPAANTWPIIEAQGFRRYCSGMMFAVPLLSRAEPGMRVEIVTGATPAIPGLPQADLDLLRSHADYGCLSLLCRVGDEAMPFIMVPKRIKHGRFPTPGDAAGVLPRHRRAGPLRRRARPLPALARPAAADRRCQRADRRPPRRLHRVARPQILQGAESAAARRSRRNRTRAVRAVTPKRSPPTIIQGNAMHQPLKSRTAAEALVDQLVINGVKHVFCVPGESFLPVLNALRDRDITITVCRHEGGAAMMAEAIGKATGQPGICFVTRGPGATNASAGIHVAQQDSTPMIMFVGQVERGVKEREAFQELDYRAVFGSMTKWTTEIDDPRARHRTGVARVLHRDQRPAGPGGDRAAEGRAERARHRRPMRRHSAGRDLARRRRDGRTRGPARAMPSGR